MDSTYYFVSYSFTNDNKSGTGSIEITIKDGGPFVPSEIAPWIKERNNFESCILVNWKQLEPNQWCGEDNE